MGGKGLKRGPKADQDTTVEVVVVTMAILASMEERTSDDHIKLIVVDTDETNFFETQ